MLWKEIQAQLVCLKYNALNQKEISQYKTFISGKVRRKFCCKQLVHYTCTLILYIIS